MELGASAHQKRVAGVGIIRGEGEGLPTAGAIGARKVNRARDLAGETTGRGDVRHEGGRTPRRREGTTHRGETKAGSRLAR